MMTLLATVLLSLVFLGTTSGQLLFKAASVGSGEDDFVRHWWSLALNWMLWLAVAIYSVEFFLYLAFLSLVPLWQGVMAASADLMLVMLGGRIFFGEIITLPRFVSISLIAIGVFLVGWGGA